jgi:hypothetical protein
MAGRVVANGLLFWQYRKPAYFYAKEWEYRSMFPKKFGVHFLPETNNA